MNIKCFSALLVFIGCFFTTANSQAEETPRHRYFGMAADVGVPDGAAIGLVLHPVNWARFGISGTHNAMAPGIRGGLTIDPLDFGIAPTATFEFGHAFEGKVPGASDSPSFSYDYMNLHLGLDFGSRDKWRFFIHGGASFLSVQSHNFNSVVKNTNNSIVFTDPTLDARITPTAKLGFALFF